MGCQGCVARVEILKKIFVVRRQLEKFFVNTTRPLTAHQAQRFHSNLTHLLYNQSGAEKIIPYRSEPKIRENYAKNTDTTKAPNPW